MAENSLKAEIKSCSCRNEQQDRMYGKNMRVHNPFKTKDGKTLNYRCTVCNKERT